MTNERWLRWAIARHFRKLGFEVRMKPAKVGFASIDGEVLGAGWKMALEIKSGNDDAVRGLGQLISALAHGYNSVALVVSLRHTKKLDPEVYCKWNIAVLGVDSKGEIHQAYP